MELVCKVGTAWTALGVVLSTLLGAHCTCEWLAAIKWRATGPMKGAFERCGGIAGAAPWQPCNESHLVLRFRMVACASHAPSTAAPECSNGSHIPQTLG